MNRRLVKTIVDLLLLAGLVVMGVTGVGLYLAPPGRIARATNWMWLGMDKHVLGDVHAYFGFAMLTIAVLHLLLNWKPLKSLLKTLSRSDAVKIAAAVLIVIAGVFIYLGG